MVLSVSKPDGSVFQKTFDGSSSPYFELSADCTDGSYTYELRLMQELRRQSRREVETEKSGFRLQPWDSKDEERGKKALVQTGYFQVLGGRIVTGGGTEPGPPIQDPISIQDIVHNDDVIIIGSLAVGFDAVNGENFGSDTIRLKENNLRIHFDDTSSTASFPRNDWRILINDNTNGGASYFSIEDSSHSARPFTIEASAPANSLYVDDGGRIGLGISVPSVELHIADGDTPAVRLDQDGSWGFAAQRWDIAGNETNFFIRDVTNGSRLPFRIQPSTPSNTLCLRSDGKVGIGTWSPASSLEIENTGEDVILLLDRTDGVVAGFGAFGDFCAIGTATNHILDFVINGNPTMTLRTNGSLHMSSGARCTGAGVWTDASSREYKENIQDLTAQEAMDTLEGLNPVKYNYKKEQKEKHVGFIAEDVPELVASQDRKTMSPMDVVAILTKVVKEQQKTISELQKRIEELEKKPQID
jgi:hypothetical protein